MCTSFMTFLCAFIILAAIVAVELTDTLSSIISLTVFGILLAIVFVIFQAPDVALTQAVINSGLVTSLFLVAYSRTQTNICEISDNQEQKDK